MLTKTQKDAIRGMLADKQSVKTIAEEMEVDVEDVEDLKPPKSALSAFMLFCKDYREQVAAEVGSAAPNVVSKALGEKWGQTTDRHTWEKQAEKDKARYDKEMAAHTAMLDEEAADVRRERDAYAAGPSDREAERSQKRQEMQEETAKRNAEPKKEKKQRTATAAEKSLAQQNKEVLADTGAQAKKRLSFLLGQSDLFKHFGVKDEDADKKKKAKGRMTEKAGDEEMLNALGDGDEGGGGGSGQPFEEKVRVTKMPDTINHSFGEMRPYQIAGLNWLANLYQNGINGILADEMGLGKTLQSISLLAWLKQTKGFSGPFLVLAPKSTLANWQREFKHWAPCFDVMLFHGDKDQRQALIDERFVPGGFDVIVTSYEMVVREAGAFRKFAWRYLIVDEAHRMKNEESKLSQILRTFDTHSRLLITGTPLQNNLHELWALLNFLLPDVFTNSEDFDSWFDLKDKQVEQEVITQLHRVLKPFLLRRIKVDVESSIPPKTELIVYTQLAPMQREQYKNILKRDMDALYQSSGTALTANKSRLMNLVMQLRKCCNHPYLFEGAEDKSLDPFGDHLVTNCGKLLVLDRLLLRLKKNSSRVLIFSQMTRQLDILEDYCAYRRNDGFTYCRIDGSTNGNDRQDSIDAFNAPNSQIFIFLLSTRAGGLGINLQTADSVVIYDSDWNPQADLQAQDRAHRIGQKKEVKVFRFVTADSIEEKVVERAEQKLQMDAAVIQSGRLAEKQKALSKEDALSAVRFGADKIFRAGDEELTEQEIDTMLASAKDMTAERKGLENKEKKDLLDFSDATVNFQEFEGIDYKGQAAQGDMSFMEIMQDAMGKRERTGTSYNERDYAARSMATTSVEKGLPKPKKMPDMKDFQLFNHARIAELYEAEHQRDLKKAKELKRHIEAKGEAAEPPPEAPPTAEELAELAERERLEQDGFPTWSKQEYTKFLRGSEKHGRTALQPIADEVGTKTLEEVVAYSKAFYAQGPLLIVDFDKQEKKIDEGERKIAEKERMATALKAKVSSTDNPWNMLALKYGNNRGKLFTEEEDRFLVCMTNELGYGNWDDLKREVRRAPDFRFDWLFKSRTPIELGRRVDLLIRLIQNENKEKEPRGAGKKSAVEAADDDKPGKKQKGQANGDGGD